MGSGHIDEIYKQYKTCGYDGLADLCGDEMMQHEWADHTLEGVH